VFRRLDDGPRVVTFTLQGEIFMEGLIDNGREGQMSPTASRPPVPPLDAKPSHPGSSMWFELTVGLFLFFFFSSCFFPVLYSLLEVHVCRRQRQCIIDMVAQLIMGCRPARMEASMTRAKWRREMSSACIGGA
jgi:hypothetical protein